MKLVFFTDFDRTIIFSKRFLDKDIESECIEHKKGQPISYMTTDAIELLAEVKQKTVFIPVTTRTWELINRVDLIKEDMPEWLVCSNGGRIYHNGELLEEWDIIIKQKLYDQQYSIKDIREIIRNKIKKSKIKKIILYEDTFLMIKFTKLKPNILNRLAKLNSLFKSLGYRIEVNSNKVYIMPEFMTKEAAVVFLKEKLNAGITVSAGDSVMDMGMLAVTDFAVAPRHKTFEADFIHVTQNKGLLAGEEILNYVKDIVENQ